PVLRSTAGITLSRNLPTKLAVCELCGEGVGEATMAAVGPSAFRPAFETHATPGGDCRAMLSFPIRGLSIGRWKATATWTGSLVPGWNHLERRSYACRVVWLAGSLPASLEARRSPSAGAASASITAVAATAVNAGRRWTRCTQRSQNPDSAVSVAPDARTPPV